MCKSQKDGRAIKSPLKISVSYGGRFIPGRGAVSFSSMVRITFHELCRINVGLFPLMQRTLGTLSSHHGIYNLLTAFLMLLSHFENDFMSTCETIPWPLPRAPLVNPSELPAKKQDGFHKECCYTTVRTPVMHQTRWRNHFSVKCWTNSVLN